MTYCCRAKLLLPVKLRWRNNWIGSISSSSAAVQRADAAFVSKKRAKKGLPPVQALYTEAEAETAVRQFVAVGYDRPMPVADNIEATFRDAGHIL